MDKQQNITLSVRHSRFTGKNFLVNGKYVKRKIFFDILNQSKEARQWVRLQKTLELFSFLLGTFGTVFLVFAILLKVKGINGLAVVQFVMSVVQYAIAAMLSLRADKALGKAIEVFNQASNTNS